jgi:hypothetical protein
MDVRAVVLHTALNLEAATADLLARLMGFEAKDSRALSYGHGSLSFQQKVMFLIDLGALKEDDETLFRSFLEVRNVFAHVLSAKSYTACLDVIPEKLNYILRLSYFDYTTRAPDMKRKNLRDESMTLEQQLEKGVEALAALVAEKTIMIRDVWIARIKEQVSGEVHTEAFKVVQKRIPEIFQEHENRLVTRLATGPQMTAEEIVAVPRAIFDSIGLILEKAFPEALAWYEAQKAKQATPPATDKPQ